MERSRLERILRKSWCRETSADPEAWSPKNPAWGQCAVSAVLVQDYLGGRVVWALVRIEDGRKLSHYFNNINGREHDFTREQFPEGVMIPRGVPRRKGFRTTREYVLSYEDTRKRYELLKQRFEQFLKQEEKK